MRQLQARIKSAQYVNNMTPSPCRQLDQLQPGLQLLILNGLFTRFNQLFTTTGPADWRRGRRRVPP